MSFALDGWADITSSTAAMRRIATATVAFRRPTKGRPCVEFQLNARLTAMLGWAGGAKARLLVAPGGERLAFMPDPAGKALRPRSNGLTMLHRLEWMDDDAPARPAEAVGFEMAPGLLILSLPAWAQPAAGIPAAAPAAPAEAAQESPRTEARRELPPDPGPADQAVVMRSLWPDLGVPTMDVMARLNALPGRSFTKPSLYRFAEELGLPARRFEAYAEPQGPAAAPPQAAARPPAGFPPPSFRAPAVVPQTAAPSTEDDDEAEAEKLVRQDPVGWHARRLADYFGWDLAKASAFVVRVRRDLRAEAGA